MRKDPEPPMTILEGFLCIWCALSGIIVAGIGVGALGAFVGTGIYVIFIRGN